VALADILTRIDGDTSEETKAILDAAKERADKIVAEATARAEAHRAEVAAAAKAAATREADTIVVNSRLAARDAEVTARRALLDEALAGAADAIAGLPDADYARYLAARIAEAARGGETLSFGSADVGRAKLVTDELARVAPSLNVVVADQPAPFERGALLEGSRVRADLSLAALVEERRDDLEVVVARVLFPEEA